MTTYKELQTTLKTYREAGVELQVKLSAKREVLEAELARIEPTPPSTIIEPTPPSTITKLAQVSAWAVHTGRQLFTLLTLVITLLYMWDMELTNHPNTKLAQARISQASSFVSDVIKWQLKAQLGTTLPGVKQLLV
jgi:hypothetical protein